MRGEALTEMYRNAMLRELQANAHKDSWDTMTVREHFRELDYHMAKLKAAVGSGYNDRLRVLEYGADVGNHVCFLLEHLDVLTPELIQERAEEPSFKAASKRVYLRLALRGWCRPSWLRKAWKGMFGEDYIRQDEPSLDGFG